MHCRQCCSHWVWQPRDRHTCALHACAVHTHQQYCAALRLYLTAVCKAGFGSLSGTGACHLCPAGTYSFGGSMEECRCVLFCPYAISQGLRFRAWMWAEGFANPAEIGPSRTAWNHITMILSVEYSEPCTQTAFAVVLAPRQCVVVDVVCVCALTTLVTLFWHITGPVPSGPRVLRVPPERTTALSLPKPVLSGSGRLREQCSHTYAVCCVVTGPVPSGPRVLRVPPERTTALSLPKPVL
jgi:hypothetical protein